MEWLIENLGHSSYQELYECAKRNHEAKLFVGFDKAFDANRAAKESPFIFVGSIEGCKIVRNHWPTKGVLYCSLDNYACTKYYSYFGSFLFNQDYIILPLSELNRRKYFFYGLLGVEAKLFVRTNEGDKVFESCLVDLQDFEGWYESKPQHSLVVVASPKKIRGEWRFICSKNKDIVAHSLYRYQGLLTLIPNVPPGALELCHKILEVGYYPDSVFCVDIAEDEIGNYRLMELNGFSSADLYACDKERIVQRVSEIALEDFENLTKKLQK